MQVAGLEVAGGRLALDGAAPDEPAGPVAVEFVLRRNCSLSPRALMAVFASVAAVSFGFGAVFAALGAWLVLPFAGVELLALSLAFVVYGLHATDGERLRLEGGRLAVEVTEGRETRMFGFPAHAVRLLAEGGGLRGQRLFLVCQGRRLEVGRHLGAERRAVMERDLREALREAARGS